MKTTRLSADISNILDERDFMRDYEELPILKVKLVVLIHNNNQDDKLRH